MSEPAGTRVAVLAPTGRDAELLTGALAAASIPTSTLASPIELLSTVGSEVTGDRAPQLGAVLVTDDTLGVEWSTRLVKVLDAQPSWSDLPIVLLAGLPDTRGDGVSGPRGLGTVAERLSARGSVTLLDRPVRVATLVSAVRAAMRARSRQAEARELIEGRRRAQEEAERQRAEAMRAAEAKGQFLANMSHELRTPLNAIAGHIELIEMGLYGEINAEQRAALARVQRAQQHLLGLINDVLNYSRLESGHVEYDLQATSLGELVADVASMIEPQMRAAALRFDVRVNDEAGRVLVDRDKLRQVLLNLLGNALKFTPPGGWVVVDYGTRRTSHEGAPGDVVHLRVRDGGIGIPRERQAEIFEPFVQLGRTLAQPREGTGLGLAISRDLARAMGGDLRVRSREGGGSSFTVTLRRADRVVGALDGAVAPDGRAALDGDGVAQ